MPTRLIALFYLFAALAGAAVSNNASLTGGYYFRHVLIVTDGGSGITEMRSAGGTITFNGAGGFTYTGQQMLGTGAPTALNGSGTFTVKAGGITSLTNPLRAGATINARLGKGALVGASTEAGATVFDLFLAIPVSGLTLSNATLAGGYSVSSLEFPSATLTNIRETQSTLTANGAGGFAETSVTGQARNLGNQITAQTVAPMTYQVSGNGSGTLTFPAGAGQTDTSQLITGVKNVYVSEDGTYFMGGSLSAGLHGIVVGVKTFAGDATNASWTGAFYNAGLRFDANQSRLASVAAGVYVTSLGAVFGRRTHQSDGLFDAATLATYSLAGDGSGPFTSTAGRVNVGSTSDVFSTSGISFAGAATYELSFGARMIPQSGTGVFVDPQGVLNGASFAVGYPIAPGSFVALFGSGMGTQTATASTLPFPKLLGNVSLTVNGIAAPLVFVSPGFIKFIVPYGVTGPTATIVVTANNVASNAVEVPLAASAPGIFSLSQNGLGDGALRHGNASIVTAANPAKLGEFLEMYLTGMGGVTPALLDGAPAPLTVPLAVVTGPVVVTIGGVPCEVAFSGLTPGLAGLYQLNIKIPASLTPGSYSLAVQTLEGFTDMVNIWVGQ